MTQPTAFGRYLPKNDSERDDFTPGAGGKWVTCVDTSVGRAVAWATNGRIDVDGKVYRAHVVPPDPDGITFEQAALAVHAVAKLDLIIPASWTLARATGHLVAGKGLAVIGQYATIPADYRSQAGDANFRHCLWFSHISATSGVRMWDALDPRAGFGRWVPLAAFQSFVTSEHFRVAYVPLSPLAAHI